MRGFRWLFIVTVGVFPMGVQSAGAAVFEGRFSAWISPENPKCTCRYKGEHLPLGARRCLQTPQGPRSAECVMEQNVTSWRPSGDACPQASLELQTD